MSQHSNENESNNPHYPHFQRGSLIQLGTGVIKHVEDLTTEDFTESAKRSLDLQVDSSIVVQISPIITKQGMVTIDFCVGSNTIQVKVESTIEHPFFVFGRGWCSCNPQKTFEKYHLTCQPLQIGDRCLSLTKRNYLNSYTKTNFSSETAGFNVEKDWEKSNDVKFNGELGYRNQQVPVKVFLENARCSDNIGLNGINNNNNNTPNNTNNNVDYFNFNINNNITKNYKIVFDQEFLNKINNTNRIILNNNNSNNFNNSNYIFNNNNS